MEHPLIRPRCPSWSQLQTWTLPAAFAEYHRFAHTLHGDAALPDATERFVAVEFGADAGSAPPPAPAENATDEEWSKADPGAVVVKELVPRWLWGGLRSPALRIMHLQQAAALAAAAAADSAAAAAAVAAEAASSGSGGGGAGVEKDGAAETAKAASAASGAAAAASAAADKAAGNSSGRSHPTVRLRHDPKLPSEKEKDVGAGARRHPQAKLSDVHVKLARAAAGQRAGGAGGGGGGSGGGGGGGGGSSVGSGGGGDGESEGSGASDDHKPAGDEGGSGGRGGDSGSENFSDKGSENGLSEQVQGHLDSDEEGDGPSTDHRQDFLASQTRALPVAGDGEDSALSMSRSLRALDLDGLEANLTEKKIRGIWVLENSRWQAE